MAWTQVGSIRKSDDEFDDQGNITKHGNLYIKLHGNNDKSGKFSVKNLRELANALENAGSNGVALSIEKPQDKLKRLSDLGYIDEDDLVKRLEAIPKWLKYEITLRPPKD